jgi:hypothetical protein
MKLVRICVLFVFGFLTIIASCVKDDMQKKNVKYVDQGTEWTDEKRGEFYVWGQGSELLPYTWLLALKDNAGQPFLADGLKRYGLLPMDGRKLPVGFTLGNDINGIQQVGLNCAACHTRQINVGEDQYRIDGGPALFNMEQMIRELIGSLDATINDPVRFNTFHAEVVRLSKELGQPAPPDLVTFKAQVAQRILPERELLAAALPTPNMWGPGRIDALNQIFNRAAGIDLAVAPALVVPEAFAPADVPVRPPFLWNIGKQDYTQWGGTFANGNKHQSLLRNTSEVIGVFAHFKPVADPSKPDGFDMLKDNSTDFEGLKYLEELIAEIGPPRWPFEKDAALAAQGKAIFETECASCHGPKPGEARPPSTTEIWATPSINVNTDATYYKTLARTAPTGPLSGILGPVALIGNISGYMSQAMNKQYDPTFKSLPGRTPPAGSYEARVLEGIWAAAPYLHNGSVPTLDDLLKPAAQRPTVFYIGTDYDISKVGLSSNQEPSTGYEYNTTVKGNGNEGHEYGTQLSAQQKSALIEYLKSL